MCDKVTPHFDLWLHTHARTFYPFLLRQYYANNLYGNFNFQPEYNLWDENSYTLPSKCSQQYSVVFSLRPKLRPKSRKKLKSFAQSLLINFLLVHLDDFYKVLSLLKKPENRKGLIFFDVNVHQFSKCVYISQFQFNLQCLVSPSNIPLMYIEMDQCITYTLFIRWISFTFLFQTKTIEWNS